MTEDEAETWIADRWPARIDNIRRFAQLLLVEAERQSLIAKSTIASIWSRHLVDSAQLVPLAPQNGTWVDVGSGGGLPGMVIAILRDEPTVLVEPRRMRAQFLLEAVDKLALTNVRVCPHNAQSLDVAAAVVSARAVASMDRLFNMTRHFVSRETVYILPRGLSVTAELSAVAMNWKAKFHVEHSVLDRTAGIVIATAVRAR